MTGRGDWLAIGLLTALTAGATARGRRAGRNLTTQDEADLATIRARMPDVDLLNEVQIKAMGRGQFVLPDGALGSDPFLFEFSKRPFRRGARVSPIKAPTLRGMRASGRFRVTAEPRRVDDFYDEEVYSAVLELDAGGDVYRYFLPASLFDLE